MSERIREVLGELDAPCRVCGDGCLVAVETRAALRFRDRIRPDADRRVTRYETCLDCGSTVPLITRNPRLAGGGEAIPPGYVAL